MAKASVKCNRVICKSFDEALLILLAIKSQDKCFLTGLNDSVRFVYQNAWQNKRFSSYKKSKVQFRIDFSQNCLTQCFFLK